jgi:hypothetical protein
MTVVQPLFAQWLQADADFATTVNAALVAAWGETAAKSERITGIARAVDAQAEAARQLAFLGRGPFGVDEHQMVGGDWEKRLGQVVRLKVDRLGYHAGIDVFVIGAQVDRGSGLSVVTVLCPLKDAA